MSIIGNSLLIGSSGGGGGGPILLVTVTGATATSVTAVNGGQSVSLAYDSAAGKWWAVLPSTGTWTVTATWSTQQTKSATVAASSVSIYETSLSQPNLPAGYTELEYLQVDDDIAYIDVGVDITTQNVLSGKFAMTSGMSAVSGNSHASCDVYTTQTDSPFLRLVYQFYTNEFYYTSCQSGSYNAQLGQGNGIYADHVFTTNGRSIVFDGQSFSAPSGGTAATTASRICLFRTMNLSGNWPCYSHSKIYWFKIANSDGVTFLRDFIPAKRNSDTVLGMYDIKNDVFYTNAAGSGSFIAGPEV